MAWNLGKTALAGKAVALGNTGRTVTHVKPFDDARVDIAAEGFAQAFLVTQLLDHFDRHPEVAAALTRWVRRPMRSSV